MNELLPCPFCGGEIRENEHIADRYSCPDLGCAGCDVYASRVDWNKRPIAPKNKGE